MNNNRALVVLAAISAILLLYWGQPFFVPLFIAILIAYALAPLVDAMTRVLRYRAASAGVVVALLLALAGAAAWAWSDDMQAAWDAVPTAARQISRSLTQIAQRPGSTVAEVKQAAAEMEAIGNAKGPSPAKPAAPAAPVSPGAMPMWQVLWKGSMGVIAAAIQVMVVVFLVFFILASGDLFKRKLLAIAGERWTKRGDILAMIDEIERQVHSYLAVLLVSNILVGVGTWIALRLIGVQYAELWGLAAGILHTAPYFGPAIIAAGTLAAAFVQTGSWSMAFLASGATVLVSSLVGMVFATWLASRRTNMNTTAAFVGLLFFGWLWGFWGVLLAIPLLAIVKTICEHRPSWSPVAKLLGQ